MMKQPFYLAVYKKVCACWAENQHQFSAPVVQASVQGSIGGPLSKLTSIGALRKMSKHHGHTLLQVVLPRLSDAEVVSRVRAYEATLKKVRKGEATPEQLPLSLCKPAPTERVRPPRDGVFIRIRGVELTLSEARKVCAELDAIKGWMK